MESLIGMRSKVSWEATEDKENNLSCNNVEAREEEGKKCIRSNYCMLKWMVNYSRFAAKLLPKIDQLSVSEEERESFVELAARCMHMTISKLHRVEQLHEQLGLINYSQFRRTSRYSKIRSVTEEYHQKYLLMLSKLPYTYSLPPMLALQFNPKLVSHL
jgi:hypothetical protein